MSMPPRFQLENSDFEIQFYKRLLDKKPDFVEALSLLGDLYTKKGFHKEGLEIDKRLARLRPGDPVVFYNLACSYSLSQDIDSALRIIKQAINYGYDEFEHLETDKDLENLRKDKRFQRYFLRQKNKKSNNQAKEENYLV